VDVVHIILRWPSRIMNAPTIRFVVKNRAPPPKAWRWEIYRAGNANPIKQSSIYFDTTAAARRAGKDALKELLNKLFN
jgi:hypothetical protein